MRIILRAMHFFFWDNPSYPAISFNQLYLTSQLTPHFSLGSLTTTCHLSENMTYTFPFCFNENPLPTNYHIPSSICFQYSGWTYVLITNTCFNTNKHTSKRSTYNKTCNASDILSSVENQLLTQKTKTLNRAVSD